MNRVVAAASNTVGHRVLHIRLQPSSSPESRSRRSVMEELLAGFPLEMEECGDVYRGLARLLRPASAPLRAVIVCLDGLGTPEFEFFSIVSRLRRGLKVYVYAGARGESRIARAVEFGATGPVTREALGALAGGEPAATAVQAATEVPEHTSDKSLSPAPPTAASEPQRVDDEDARKSARVPWLRYGDRPARVAPAARAPAPQPPPQVDRPPPRTASFEPLLTEEELRALMSDDIAAISPGDSAARRSGDNDHARGAP